MFGRKKKINKATLFGSAIEPSCTHCLNSVTVQGEARCRIGQAMSDGKCKKYTYDPLRRTPKGDPKLRSYSAKDFEL